MRKIGQNPTAAIRGRHKAFFKRLDRFLKNYTQGFCGESEANVVLSEAKNTQQNAKQ